MTTIGILGTGRMVMRLATLFADRGHVVTLGSHRLGPCEGGRMSHSAAQRAGAAVTHGTLALTLHGHSEGDPR